MNATRDSLDRLAPAHPWEPRWDDVLARAGKKTTRREILTPRRLVVAVALATAVLVPLTAVGATNDWWFFRLSSPPPTNQPIVVKTGEWDGDPWQLIAYTSSTDGLCFAMDTHGTAGSGGMACTPFAGVSRTSQTNRSPDVDISYLGGGANGQQLSYLAGPVIGAATEVEVKLADGTSARTPTSSGPAALDGVNFYALQLPAPTSASTSASAGAPFVWIAGLDGNGTVVACYVPATANQGISPVSACQ